MITKAKKILFTNRVIFLPFIKYLIDKSSLAITQKGSLIRVTLRLILNKVGDYLLSHR